MASLQQELLRWYDRAARDLPWRHTRDPYAVWVSEIMLQQTRVETVVPYYERFLARFPTAKALADADEDVVLSLWSGLGYYRRARLLHAGVREVVEHYGGEVPEDVDARHELPGIGRYTAGAIGSIAFGKREPVVDGNVTRVLSRLFRIEAPIGSAAATKRLWKEAGRLVPKDRPGDFNQALMELGATVCTPKQPRCGVCPVADRCQARAHDEVAHLPVQKPRKAPTPLRLAAVVSTTGRGKDRKVWLLKGQDALFGGLWGVPMTDREPLDALAKAGLRARLGRHAVAKVEHVLTHRRLSIDVYRASGARGEESSSRRPFTPAELAEVGISTLTRKILDATLVR